MVEIVNSVVYDIMVCLFNLTLCGYKPTYFRELAECVRKRRGHSNTTIQKYLRLLEEKGFLTVEKARYFPFKTKIAITKKGIDLTMLLKEMEKIISNS